jgi:hypothetical protein
VAELVLKVGSASSDPRNYQDGDIIEAYNDHSIQCCHAYSICFPRGPNGNPVDRHGYRLDPNGLARAYLDQSSEYRFERLTRTTARRITLRTMSADIVGPATKTNVPGWIERRLAYVNRPEVKGGGKAIFGPAGLEVWYANTRPVSPAGLSVVWALIEATDGRLRVDHRRAPNLDMRKYLVMRVDDFDDETMSAYTLARHAADGTVIVKRGYRVPFRSLLTAREVSDVDDRQTDVRISREFTRSSSVEAKP